MIAIKIIRSLNFASTVLDFTFFGKRNHRYKYNVGCPPSFTNVPVFIVSNIVKVMKITRQWFFTTCIFVRKLQHIRSGLYTYIHTLNFFLFFTMIIDKQIETRKVKNRKIFWEKFDISNEHYHTIMNIRRK